MSNSGFGIASVVLGGLSIFFFGSGLGFIFIAGAFICAFIGLMDPNKYKWAGITGASLAGFAMLMCCLNIMIQTGPRSSLIRNAGLYDEDEEWEDDDWNYDDDDDWDDDDWEEDEDYSDDDWEDEEDDTDDDWENDSDSSWSDDAGSGSSGSSGSTGNSGTSGSTGSSDTTSDSSLTDPYSSLGSGSSSSTTGTADDEPYDEDKIYHLGDIWTVPGQWRFTILKVEPTTFRDELPETDSGAVYYVYYRYENLGYVDPDGVWDGLYFDLSSADITDKEGYMGYSYPGQVENYATEAPVGGYAEGVSCIGVDTPGDFTIVVDKYDGKDEYREATFEIKVN